MKNKILILVFILLTITIKGIAVTKASPSDVESSFEPDDIKLNPISKVKPDDTIKRPSPSDPSSPFEPEDINGTSTQAAVKLIKRSSSTKPSLSNSVSLKELNSSIISKFKKDTDTTMISIPVNKEISSKVSEIKRPSSSDPSSPFGPGDIKTISSSDDAISLKPGFTDRPSPSDPPSPFGPGDIKNAITLETMDAAVSVQR